MRYLVSGPLVVVALICLAIGVAAYAYTQRRDG